MGKLTIIIFVGFIVFFGSLLIPVMKESYQEQQSYCREENITGQCNYAVARCSDDCKSLNKEYFKWSDGGFESAECWCKVNNETMQIW